MYTYYEQFQVVRSLLDHYAKEQFQQFTEYSARLKDYTSNSTFDINNPSIIQILTQTANQMNICQQNYLKAQGVLNKFEQVSASSYGTSTSLDSQENIAAFQEKGDDMFLEALSSKDCSDIMSDMAYSLYIHQQFPIDIKASYDMEAISEREDQIKSLLDSGKITKEQAIYWSTMQVALCNSQDFINYANQFEKSKSM